MPSSTSSSDERCPSGKWPRTWMLTVLLAGLGLLVWEFGLRARGYVPSVTDDADLWALHCERIDQEPRSLVCLGASRMQLGFHAPTFRRLFPDHSLVQLAIDGSHPLGSLEKLAERGFGGVILCAVTPLSFHPQIWDTQDQHWRHLERAWGPSRRVDRALRNLTQSHLLLCRNDLNARHLASAIIRSSWPERYLTTFADRSRAADYEVANLKALRERFFQEAARQLPRTGNSLPPASWFTGLARARQAVQSIQGRGGSVVFVSFPLDGALRDIHEERLPRAAWWDRIGPETGAMTLHDRDVAGWQDVRCPDFSHIDGRDAPGATERLLEELTRRGVL